MKALLHENKLECYEKQFEQTKMIDLSEESVVFDRMPDIGLLGNTGSYVVLRGKKAGDGNGVLEGDLIASVCYIPDGSEGYQSIELSIPWQVDFESDDIVRESVLVGEVSIAQSETRMLNPRKVLLNVQLCVKLTAYGKKKFEVYDGMEENDAIQIRKQAELCSITTAVTEKTFAATDEYPLSAELRGGRVLSKSAQFRIDDIKSLANKLIMKGSVLSDVVITTEQGESERLSFTSGFSFIAETECELVSTDVCVSLLPTGVFYELTSDGKTLSVEVHGVCQIVCYERREVRYIGDAYSNFYACEKESFPLTVYGDTKNVTHRETATVSLHGKSVISSIKFATAQVQTHHEKKNVFSLPLSVSVCVLYENGTSDWQKKQIDFDVKRKDGEKLLAVRVADIYSVSNGTEIELRIVLEVDVREEREYVLNCISEIVVDEEQPYCQIRPTISVIRGEGDLWELARTYGSTVDLIKSYNEISEDELTEGKLLLIPKQTM